MDWPNSIDDSENPYDSARVPDNGSFLDIDSNLKSAWNRLPNYGLDYGLKLGVPAGTGRPVTKLVGLSGEGQPLTTTDCYYALLSTTCKARLIGFEIARRNVSFLRRKFKKKFRLQGDPRAFDYLILSNDEDFRNVSNIRRPQRISTSLDNLLKTLLEADRDFEDSSARLKSSILRIEKDFEQNVVEPLKKAMIHRSTPNYQNLMAHAHACRNKVLPVFQLWREVVVRVKQQILRSDAWHEATELDSKIRDLKGRVQSTGWLIQKDENFHELGVKLENVFERPDGPSSLITYLSSVLSSKEHQPSTN